MEFIKAFVVGGLICVVAQILMDTTKLTPARILVIFVTLGTILGAFGIYDKLIDFGGAGATIPLPGFGNTLAKSAMKAVDEFDMYKFAIAGGVASNGALRQAMEEACEKRDMKFYYPSPILCTDNAAMIGAAAYYEYMNGSRAGLDLNAVPNLKLGER